VSREVPHPSTFLMILKDNHVLNITQRICSYDNSDYVRQDDRHIVKGGWHSNDFHFATLLKSDP